MKQIAVTASHALYQEVVSDIPCRFVVNNFIEHFPSSTHLIISKYTPQPQHQLTSIDSVWDLYIHARVRPRAKFLIFSADRHPCHDISAICNESFLPGTYDISMSIVFANDDSKIIVASNVRDQPALPLTYSTMCD